jgi:hypothetical protein
MIPQLLIEAEKSFIGAWYMEDMSLCDDIITYFENSPLRTPGVINRDGKGQVIPEEKDSLDIGLNFSETITKRYIEELQKILNLYKIKYVRADATSKFGIEAINVQKYNPRGGYKTWHTERSDGYCPNVYRHLVFMTYLNDVTDDGETEFYYQKIKIKPEKGLTLIWPSDWTHTHRGLPSPTQVKYIATGWYSFLNSSTSSYAQSLKVDLCQQ